MKTIYLGVLLFFTCSKLVSMDLREDSGKYTLSTTRVVNLGSVHVAPAVPVNEALSDLFEPHSSRQSSAAFQINSLADQLCRQHDIRQGTIVHTALRRHYSGETATRSTEDLKEVLLSVIEKSELLVQHQTQTIENKDQELVRQTTLFEGQQEKANTDKKKWACGGVAATVGALLVPFIPLLSMAYTSIAGQCAEQCAELCS